MFIWVSGGDAHYATVEDYAVSNGGKHFFNSYWNGNQGGFYGLSTGFNADYKYAGLSGNYQMFTGTGYNNTGTGYLPMALDIGGNISGASGTLSGRIGTKNTGVFGNVNGSMYTLDGNLSTGIFTGEGGKKGLMLEGNVGAYAAKGEYTYGFALGGLKWQSTVGGSFASAHIGWSSNAYYNGNNGSFIMEFQENIGFGIGEKFGLKIQIPLPFSD